MLSFDSYISSQYQKIDFELLNIIRSRNSSFGFNDQACNSMKFEISKLPQLKLFMNEYIIAERSKSTHPDFVDSCILTNGIHRIIISLVFCLTLFSALYPSGSVLASNSLRLVLWYVPVPTTGLVKAFFCILRIASPKCHNTSFPFPFYTPQES